DPTTTQIIGQPRTIECPGIPQQMSGFDTRGGQSGASISEACRLKHVAQKCAAVLRQRHA
ncbi:hypothetical protein ACCS53_39390, partial [Rhizobium ruizarguesonis]